ncbi:MAG TPA: MFS transporter [Thermoleophilaceae bacterium]|nr:MFS transporter [Thermoleophilaceae bacterium]
MNDRKPHLAPLVLATVASQALLVVLAPTMVAIARDMGGSTAVVGQARAITAAAAIVAAIVAALREPAPSVRRLLELGGVLAVAGCAAVATSPSLPPFLLAHAFVGSGLALLLSGAFAGVAAFPASRRTWALGHVTAGNALAWIVVNPPAGALAERASWRAAQAVPAALALAALLASRRASDVPGEPERGGFERLRNAPSARRWVAAEALAYAAWAALLTFAGAFFVERLLVGEQSAAWLLAAGAAMFFLTASRGSALRAAIPRRGLLAGSALAMSALLLAQVRTTGSPALAALLFGLTCAMAGMRGPASSALGLAQLPEHPGTIMAARTAATQLGYLTGGVVGGAVIAAAGYQALAVVLSAGMAASAVLMLGVHDPLETESRAPPLARPAPST